MIVAHEPVVFVLLPYLLLSVVLRVLEPHPEILLAQHLHGIDLLLILALLLWRDLSLVFGPHLLLQFVNLLELVLRFLDVLHALGAIIVIDSFVLQLRSHQPPKTTVSTCLLDLILIIVEWVDRGITLQELRFVIQVVAEVEQSGFRSEDGLEHSVHYLDLADFLLDIDDLQLLHHLLLLILLLHFGLVVTHIHQVVNQVAACGSQSQKQQH